MFGGLLGAKPEESIDETDAAAPVEGEKEGGKEGDVREHMVDILFSKGNLSGLQKQASAGQGSKYLLDNGEATTLSIVAQFQVSFAIRLR